MSRAGGSGAIVVKATNNVYTAMVIVATLVQILALVVVVLRYQTVFGSMIFQS